MLKEVITYRVFTAQRESRETINTVILLENGQLVEDRSSVKMNPGFRDERIVGGADDAVDFTERMVEKLKSIGAA
ncbi:hypothetical protein JW710_00895 [Candidatus Dojkabacteria bacterium]|nr:hypothetical protein [Candidatus Dojkabacteria bacterium]